MNLYDAEMRRDPPLPPGLTATRAGGVVRLSGLYDCVVFSDLCEANVEAQVAAVVEDLRSTGGRLEWKVHGHDRPARLMSVLEHHGFAPDPEETLLAREIDEAFLNIPVNEEVAIMPVANKKDADDFLAATEASFGEPFAYDIDHFLSQIEAGEAALHVAYLGGAPVAAGRLECRRGAASPASIRGASGPTTEAEAFIARWSAAGRERRRSRAIDF